MPTPRTLAATDVHERLERGEHLVVIDVREAEEYRSLHAAGAVPLPLAEVSAEAVADKLAAGHCPDDATVCFICHSGRRAAEAGTRVFERYSEAIVIEGGTLAWAQAGLPVHSGDEP